MFPLLDVPIVKEASKGATIDGISTSNLYSP
jgi:hypothetical protein